MGGLPVPRIGVAEKADQRRRIDRLRREFAGDPAPLVVDLRPPAVMERREAQGSASTQFQPHGSTQTHWPSR
jgi:hypothetical protein